jgi:localization factor PodJL
MTSGVPWQIKGVSRQTREAACAAARRSGISVAEWLDRVILDLALQDGVDPRRLAQPRYDPYEDGGDEDVRPSCCLDRAVETQRDDLADISLMLQGATSRKAVEAVESEVRKLADRVDGICHAGADGGVLAADMRGLAETGDAFRALMPAGSLLGMARAVRQLSHKIAKLVEKLDASEARLNHLEAIERGLADLLIHLARRRVPNIAHAAAPPPPELDALSRDVADLKQTEKKTQDSFDAVHGALEHVIDRVAVIETNMRGKAALQPSPLAPTTDWLAPSGPTPPNPQMAAATPATAESASTAQPTPKPAAFPTPEHRPIDPSLPPDHPLEPVSGAARIHKPAASADCVLASESALAGAKPSVIPDRGGKSDFIAAARRAAQEAGRDVATGSAVSKIAFAAGGSASGAGKLRALIGGMAAILIVLGLLQIARVLVSPSDKAKLTTPSRTAVTRGLDTPATDVPAPASASEPAFPALHAPPPGSRPSAIFSAIDDAAVTPGGTSILVPVWTPEQQPEATGQVQTSARGRDGARAATAASTPSSANPAPSAVSSNLDLAMPRPAQ